MSSFEESSAATSSVTIKGCDFDWLAGRVAELLGMEVAEALKPGRYPQTVKARSIMLYWPHRDLEIPTTELARRMNLSHRRSAISYTGREKQVRENGYTLPSAP